DLPGPYNHSVMRDDTTLDRTFTLMNDGLAHYGMLADFAEEMQRRDPGAADSLYQSGVRTLLTWKRATRVAAAMAGHPSPPAANPGACGRPACSDGIDNDGDGLADFPADPDCADTMGVAEVPEPAFWQGLAAGAALLAALSRRRRRAQRLRQDLA